MWRLTWRHSGKNLVAFVLSSVFFRNEHFPLIEEERSTEANSGSENNDDDFELTQMDSDEEDTRLTAKWLGCADHKLQLVLKVLDSDNKFVLISSAIFYVLSTIRKSSNAVRDFTELANRTIVLPNETR